MEKCLLLFVWIALSTAAVAQKPVRISGAVADSLENISLPGVNVVLKNVRDSTRITGIATDTNGQFTFGGVTPGRYLLKLSYIGYATVEKTLSVRGGDIDLGTLTMTPSVTTLRSIEIESTAVRVEQKEDTIRYNATAFKTNPDATAEDLLAKMPGITVDEKGVKAQGEDVKQILLDGKKFFGDDPNIALRNLPAEIIDKVEVFDQLSEQSQFTGFDDGDTQKTINIRTKRGMNNGQFGKASAGAGEDDRYIASANYNSFSGARRATLLGLSNNINQQNFSTDDLLGVTGSTGGGRGGGRGGRGGGQREGGNRSGGDAGNFLLGRQNGISNTNSGGLNYITEWRNKVEFSGSYFFNTADNRTITDLSRNYISRDSGMTYVENSNARSTNTNHRVHFRLRYD
ncbi:MAG TPA: carboxypeptidase regulatory-like domain-containing protein, partial [Chryseosolibacter sp.]